MPSYYLPFNGAMEIRATAAVPLRADGLLALTGSATLNFATPPPAAGDSTHIIFAPAVYFPDGQPCEIMIGNAGLLRADWGTVLDTNESDDGDVQVESDDWGTVAGVGLIAQRRDVTIRCRMLRSKPLPARGRVFQFRGRNFVVLSVQRVTKSKIAREFTVTGARWDDLGGHQVEAVPDIIPGWNG